MRPVNLVHRAAMLFEHIFLFPLLSLVLVPYDHSVVDRASRQTLSCEASSGRIRGSPDTRQNTALRDRRTEEIVGAVENCILMATLRLRCHPHKHLGGAELLQLDRGPLGCVSGRNYTGVTERSVESM